jgi:ankyrin repeat protein
VKALLGANSAKQLGTKNKKGLTPIDIATGWKGDKSIADLLVEAPKQDLLFDACKSGDLDGVLKLLEDGADPNLAKSGTGATPVHVATMWKQYHLIGPLCERGADLGKQDKAGRTPLHVAAHNQDAEMIKLLLKLGANPKLITKTGVTAREMAARSGRSDLVELFAKAEKSAETESRVPVEDAWVSVEDQVEIEQVTRFDAADGGRKAEPRDNYQRTALMRAVCVEWDEKKVVELLQRTGEDKVDIEARDIWGNTP